MAAPALFYYFGDDEAYFRALQGEFRNHGKMAMEFKRFYESTESKIQSLFLKIHDDKPAVVFLDFSKQTQDYLHLARLISRTPFDHTLIMVGMVDYLSPPEILKESIATGANLTFIKSSENFDVVFSVGKLLQPGGESDHGFANASLKEDWETGVLCKIGYVHSEGLHIETDYKLSKGDRVLLNHHWLEKKVVPSKQVFVRDSSSSNMFYQFKYNADLDFMFVDDFIPPEGMDEVTVKEKQNENEELARYYKKQLNRWLEDNLDSSLEKRAKILVVDDKFHFYQNQARTDKHPYTIRCIPYINDIQVELDRLRPQVIAVEMDNGDNAKNTVESLRKLISVIMSMFPDLSPYIIAFNSKETSLDLQNALQYSKILGHNAELSPELLIKLADMLQKKMTSIPNEVGEREEKSKVYIRKNNLASIAEILKTVTVVKISETDLVLQSEFPFPPGTNLHFTKPVQMFVNIQPVQKPSGKMPEYYGVIHSIGENEKKELRRFVNSVFFRDHDAQVNAESDEFKKLNDSKLQQKIAIQQKAEGETEATEQNVEPAEKIEEPKP